jgi:hypothetical protein
MPGIYINPLGKQFFSLSGGTISGQTTFLAGVSGTTVTVNNALRPLTDNSAYLGYSHRRFRELNVVDGVAVNFTASTQIKTQILQLGNTTITENNIILTGDTINGGAW